MTIIPILILSGLALSVPFVFIKPILVLAFIGLAVLSAGLVLFRFYMTTKDYLRAFNAYLDLYDTLDGIDIPEDSIIRAYEQLYDIYLKFADKDPIVTISYSTVKLLGYLLALNNIKLTDFIENNAYFTENIPAEYYERDD